MPVNPPGAECDLGSLEMGTEGCSAGVCCPRRLVVHLMERGPGSCGGNHWDKPHMIRYCCEMDADPRSWPSTTSPSRTDRPRFQTRSSNQLNCPSKDSWSHSHPSSGQSSLVRVSITPRTDHMAPRHRTSTTRISLPARLNTPTIPVKTISTVSTTLPPRATAYAPAASAALPQTPVYPQQRSPGVIPP